MSTLMNLDQVLPLPFLPFGELLSICVSLCCHVSRGKAETQIPTAQSVRALDQTIIA